MAGGSSVDRLRSLAPTISVGVLTADPLSLGTELALLEEAGVQVIHVDVMDGCFCPAVTVGPPFIKAIKTSLLKDVHLMVEQPLGKLEGYVAAGADMITVHVEAGRHIHRVLQVLGTMTNANDSSRGVLRGLALNPGTALETVRPLLPELEMITLLAVNPGWSGQKFIATTQQRLQELLAMIRHAGRDILVAVDGGVTKENVADVARMGADIIVTGSAVFDGKTPKENAEFMLKTVSTAKQVRG